MKKTIALVLAAGILAASPAIAAPGKTAAPAPQAANGGNGGGTSQCAPGQIKTELLTYYQLIEPTGTPTRGGLVGDHLGGALSGGFYGNTSNSGIDPDAPENGHGVTPSITPGPQTLTSGGPGTGTSIGEFIHDLCEEE